MRVGGTTLARRAPVKRADDSGLVGVRFARRRDFRRGAYLAEADCAADTLYLIVDGQVRCFLLSEDGCEATTAVLGPGQLVGAQALFGFATHRLFVQALLPVRAWALPVADVLEELPANRMLQGLVVGALAQRLALAEGLLRDVLLLPVRERMGDVERRLSATLGGQPAALRRAQLAGLLQTRPETLARISHSRSRASSLAAADVAQLDMRLFRKGEVLHGLDAPCGSINQLAVGRIQVALAGADKREVTLYTLEPGDLFGFSGLVGLPPSGLRAIALSEGAFRTESASELLAEIAQASLRLIDIGQQLARWLTSLERQVGYAARRTVRLRLIAQLHDAGEMSPTSHAWLARRIGASRETVTRTLRQLEKEGLLLRDHRRLRLQPGHVRLPQSGPHQPQRREGIHNAARDPHDQPRQLLVVDG